MPTTTTTTATTTTSTTTTTNRLLVRGMLRGVSPYQSPQCTCF